MHWLQLQLLNIGGAINSLSLVYGLMVSLYLTRKVQSIRKSCISLVERGYM